MQVGRTKISFDIGSTGNVKIRARHPNLLHMPSESTLLKTNDGKLRGLNDLSEVLSGQESKLISRNNVHCCRIRFFVKLASNLESWLVFRNMFSVAFLEVEESTTRHPSSSCCWWAYSKD
jgi:hypothetical protein